LRKPNGMGSSFLSRFAGVPNSAPHSFFHTLSAANSTTAFDKIFIASATTLSNAAGLVIVGLAGHLTTTALGRSSPGSTSSTFSVWPLRLPLESGAVGHWVDS
jgi:hypothetical protein